MRRLHPNIPGLQTSNNAAKALLTSQNRVTAVQGYAGTAKTTTVLATVGPRGVNRRVTNDDRTCPYRIGSADHWARHSALRGETVAKHLTSPHVRNANKGHSVWVVDEASMLSARDTATLLESAEKTKARVILVGDVKQLGSVGAGAAFAQLQSAGMETAKLAEIVRQTNPLTKEAVEASIQGDARRALNALDGGGGKIIALSDSAATYGGDGEGLCGAVSQGSAQHHSH